MVKMKILPEPSAKMVIGTEIIDVSDEAYNKGYTNGYANGYTEGETKGIEQGYNEGYTYGTMPIYYMNKLDFMWNNKTFPENTNLVLKLAKAPKEHNACFLQTQNIKTIKMISDDNSNIVKLAQFVRGSADLELLDLTEYNRNIGDLYLFAYTADNLKTILGALDLTNCTDTRSAFAMSHNKGALEDVEFVPNTIKISISFSSLRYLSNKSIQSIIDGLADLTGQTAQTVSFHSNVLAKLTDEQFATILSKNWSV